MLNDEEIRRLHRYGVALCGNSQEAFDLVQTAFEKILRSRAADYQSLGIAYFYTTLRNCFIDSLRARRTQPDLAADIDPDKIESLATRSLEDLTLDRLEVAELLTSLTSGERELLYLHLVEERTAEEISQMIERPRGTILSMMHRLRLKITGRHRLSKTEVQT